MGPALDRLATSDQARAYSAWARSVGEQVAASTSPKAFGRGRLTVECDSSVWANELTYLSPQILRRMDEVVPGHPVQRFRFVVGRGRPAAADSAPGSSPVGTRDDQGAGSAASAGDSPAGSPAGEESDAGAPKEKSRDVAPASAALDAARAEVEGVRDERLRAAIEAALRRSSPEPPAAPGDATPSG
jgi:hypothetical protein